MSTEPVYAGRMRSASAAFLFLAAAVILLLSPLKASAAVGEWTIDATVNPPSANANLKGVSCYTATTCVATGENLTKGYGWIEWWNGEEWYLAPSIYGYDYKEGLKSGSILNSIACRGITMASCFAVGEYGVREKPAGHSFLDLKAFETWINSAFDPPSAESDELSWMEDVTCPATGTCVAVGTHKSESKSVWEPQLGVRKNNEWSLDYPSVESHTKLKGVACSTTTSCLAVGAQWDGKAEGGVTPYSLQWNGSAWSKVTVPIPGESTFVELNDVSCYFGGCMAVGWYTDKATGNQKSLAAKWNGSTWSILSTTNEEGEGVSTVLEDVSCTASETIAQCTAVGNYHSKSSPSSTFVEKWDGISWASQASPNPAGAISAKLYGVSCTESSRCTAVGQYEMSGGKTYTLAQSIE